MGMAPGGATGMAPGAAKAPAGARPAARPVGNFTSVCRYTHSANDDPIVHPGKPGAAHGHDFFGNPSTDANSTLESLQREPSRCDRQGDVAAYWVPTLSDGGKVVHAGRVAVYYQVADHDPTSVRPLPAGLKIVTEPGRSADWVCGRGGSTTPPQSSPPDCPAQTHLILRVLFPECWDGRNLDSPDHRGHMAYGSSGTCPADHPVAVPRVRLTVQYPNGVGGSDVTLSSGGPETAHADFFNGWDVQAQTRLVEGCIVRNLRCATYTPA